MQRCCSTQHEGALPDQADGCALPRPTHLDSREALSKLVAKSKDSSKLLLNAAGSDKLTAKAAPTLQQVRYSQSFLVLIEAYSAVSVTLQIGR